MFALFRSCKLPHEPKSLTPPGVASVDFMEKINVKIDLNGLKRKNDLNGLNILECFKWAELAKLCRVNKNWNKLANTPSSTRKIVLRELVIGGAEWNLYNNIASKSSKIHVVDPREAELAKSIPANIGALVKASPESIPVWISEGMTLELLNTLNRIFKDKGKGFKYVSREFMAARGNIPHISAGWYMITATGERPTTHALSDPSTLPATILAVACFTAIQLKKYRPIARTQIVCQEVELKAREAGSLEQIVVSVDGLKGITIAGSDNASAGEEAGPYTTKRSTITAVARVGLPPSTS